MPAESKSKKSEQRDLDFKISKEFQIKIEREYGESDKDCFKLVKEILEDLEGSGLVRELTAKDGWDKKGSWQRHGERFDTEDGLFRSNRISLATEKSIKKGKKQTKLKCKLHNFVPELLFPMTRKASEVENAACYPSVPTADIEPRFKIEQDIHFNNCKYCATGYFNLPGHDHPFEHAKDFVEFFPNLGKLSGLDAQMPLKRGKDWNERVLDDIEMQIGGMEVKSALVTRRESIGGRWVESELSFKVKQSDKVWDHDALTGLARVYEYLFERYAGRYFVAEPSIFFFHAPV